MLFQVEDLSKTMKKGGVHLRMLWEPGAVTGTSWDFLGQGFPGIFSGEGPHMSMPRDHPHLHR